MPIAQTAATAALRAVPEGHEATATAIHETVQSLEETLHVAAEQEASAQRGVFTDDILTRARELLQDDVDLYGSAIRKDFSALMAKNFIYKVAGVNFGDGATVTPKLHTAEHLMTLAVSLVHAPADNVLDILAVAAKELSQLEAFLRSSVGVANVDKTATTAASDALARQPNKM